jgi:hypothetical protein
MSHDAIQYLDATTGADNSRYGWAAVTGTVNTNGGSDNSGRTALGTLVTAANGSTTNYFQGGINKLIVADRVLTNTERGAILAQLRDRAGF